MSGGPVAVYHLTRSIARRSCKIINATKDDYNQETRELEDEVLFQLDPDSDLLAQIRMNHETRGQVLAMNENELLAWETLAKGITFKTAAQIQNGKTPAQDTRALETAFLKTIRDRDGGGDGTSYKAVVDQLAAEGFDRNAIGNLTIELLDAKIITQNGSIVKIAATNYGSAESTGAPLRARRVTEKMVAMMRAKARDSSFARKYIEDQMRMRDISWEQMLHQPVEQVNIWIDQMKAEEARERQSSHQF